MDLQHRTRKPRGYDDDDPVGSFSLAPPTRSSQGASSSAGGVTATSRSSHAAVLAVPATVREGSTIPNGRRDAHKSTKQTQGLDGGGANATAVHHVNNIPEVLEDDTLNGGVGRMLGERDVKKEGPAFAKQGRNKTTKVPIVPPNQYHPSSQTARITDSRPSPASAAVAAGPVYLSSRNEYDQAVPLMSGFVLDASVAAATAVVQKDSDLNHNNKDELQQSVTTTTQDGLVEAKPFDDVEIRKQLEQAMKGEAVTAEELDEEALRLAEIKEEEERKEMEKQQRRRFRRLILLVIVLIVVIVVIVVVVVLVAGNSSNKSTPTVPTSSPTLAPSLTRRTTKPVAPPSYLPTDLNQNDAQENIFPIIQAGVNHSLMTTYLTRANLVGFLGNQQYTVFAPTDGSWRDFAASSVSYAYYVNASNPAWSLHLTFLLQYHIVTEPLKVSDLLQLFELPTAANGLHLQVSQSDGQVGDNSAIIVTADIRAFNGYINVPSKVLVASQFSRTILNQVVNTTQASSFTLHTLADIIVPSNNHDALLLEALERDSIAGLTLLAPNDDAFDQANWNTSVYNTAGNTNLTRLLIENHLIDVNLYNLQSPSTTKLLTTASGFSMWVVNDDKNETFCNGALVTKMDYVHNGVVAVVDKVLFPPNSKELLQITTNVTGSYQFDSFLNLMEEVAQLGNLLTDNSTYLTVLAPLEEAFARNASSYKLVNRWLGVGWLLHQQRLVRHHFTSQTIPTKQGQHSVLMLSGYNTSVLVQSDGSLIVSNVSSKFVENGPLRSTNGLAYFLEGVLIPAWGYNSVDEVLGQHSELSKFASLLATYNVTSVLSGTGPITLLAPSNTALAAVNISSLGSSAVRALLLGHIVNGNQYSTTLDSNVTAVTALNNQTWQVLVPGGQVTVGGGLITTPDLLANNGVIHIMDTVLGVS